MKLSKNFVLRQVLDENILIPVGEAAQTLNGMASVNDMGLFLVQALSEEQSEKTLLEKILQEYDVDAETARRDLEEFLDQLRSIGALTE